MNSIEKIEMSEEFNTKVKVFTIDHEDNWKELGIGYIELDF